MTKTARCRVLVGIVLVIAAIGVVAIVAIVHLMNAIQDLFGDRRHRQGPQKLMAPELNP